MSRAAPRDSANLRVSRAGHPRYSGRHALSAGIAENQTTHGRFLYFGLLSPKCKALTDKGKRSNKDWGRNVAKRRNKLSPPFQRRGTVWGTGAAKRRKES